MIDTIVRSFPSHFILSFFIRKLDNTDILLLRRASKAFHLFLINVKYLVNFRCLRIVRNGFQILTVENRFTSVRNVKRMNVLKYYSFDRLEIYQRVRSHSLRRYFELLQSTAPIREFFVYAPKFFQVTFRNEIFKWNQFSRIECHIQKSFIHLYFFFGPYFKNVEKLLLFTRAGVIRSFHRLYELACRYKYLVLINQNRRRYCYPRFLEFYLHFFFQNICRARTLGKLKACQMIFYIDDCDVDQFLRHPSWIPHTALADWEIVHRNVGRMIPFYCLPNMAYIEMGEKTVMIAWVWSVAFILDEDPDYYNYIYVRVVDSEDYLAMIEFIDRRVNGRFPRRVADYSSLYEAFIHSPLDIMDHVHQFMIGCLNGAENDRFYKVDFNHDEVY